MTAVEMDAHDRIGKLEDDLDDMRSEAKDLREAILSLLEILEAYPIYGRGFDPIYKSLGGKS